jgi:uncharacterized membrane protein
MMAGRGRRPALPALIAGLAFLASGVAHLLWPRAFDEVNRMAFNDNIRTHVLVNGSTEAALGLALLGSRTRRAAWVATAVYLAYFIANVMRISRGAGRD